jgi:SAM-dependent methyltransferase
MNKPISQLAVDPLQYDGDEILWGEEGHGLSPVRRMFLERLAPFLDGVAGKDVLDLGCGQGWLCDELASRGVNVLGIDPSQKNVRAAAGQYPNIRFVRSDLQSYQSAETFDLITAVMVFEHFPKLQESFEKVKTLLKSNGSVLMITGDFDKFTHPRHGYTVETEELLPGEVATRTDYGERAGVIYDINRTTERFIEVAQRTGFSLRTHEPIAAPEWLLKEQPRYAIHNGKPLFHLLNFEPKNNPAHS